MAYSRGKNPFDSDNEDDDFEDLSRDPDLARIRQQQDYHRQRMVESSNRSLALIYESQDIASNTAADLAKQGEQLKRTERNLDKMEGDLQQSDRHITSLKSIWGTMTNYFRKPLKTNTEAGATTEATAGEEPVSSKDLAAQAREDSRDISRNMNRIGHHSEVAMSSGSRSVRGTNKDDEIVDRNLDNMLTGLDFLKNQALSLGETIDEQNVQIERIHDKTGKIDTKIDDQNLKIRKILK